MNRRELIKRSALFSMAAGVRPLTSAGRITRTIPSTADPGQSQGNPYDADGSLPTAFVISKNAVLLDVAGPLEVFSNAMTASGKMPFAPYTVAASRAPVKISGGLTLTPDYTFKTAPQPKLIVIPALDEKAAQPALYDWIKSASVRAELTVSICTGAFVLARTGLLAGRPATTHHGAYFSFAAEFPEVSLRRGARYVEDGNVASSGGITSGMDLALRLVERYFGRRVAEEVTTGIEYQGRGWLDPNANDAYAMLPILDGDPPICPVCLMNGDRKYASRHGGKTYNFCGQGCKDTFDEHPEVLDRFLAEDKARSGQ